MFVTLVGIVIDVNPEQPENAEPPMLVTLSGIVTDVSPEQSSNAQSPMLVTLSGIVTDLRPEQPENAQFPMFVTLSGMTRFVTILPFRNNRWARSQGLASSPNEMPHHAGKSEM